MGWQVVDVPGGHHFGKERVFRWFSSGIIQRGRKHAESVGQLVSRVRVSSEARSVEDQVRSSAGSRVSWGISFVRVCLVGVS